MERFKQFNLPVKHLQNISEHYVPPKSRDPEEIERRRTLAPGVLMAEFQHRGIKVAKHVLEIMQFQENTLFVTRTLGASALNTAWYNFAQGAKHIMNRRLDLPTYADFDEEGITKANLIGLAANHFGGAEMYAQDLVDDGYERRRLYVRHKKIIGSTLGRASIILANTPHAEALAYDDPVFQQYIARDSAQELLEDSRTLYKQVGSNPTLAQFADQDSPLSVYWRRNAPDDAYDALEQATVIVE